MPESEMGRGVLLALLAVVVAVTVAFALGPRVPADTTVRFEPAAINGDPEAYLAAQEAKFDDIRPGLEKEIIRAAPGSREKTPYALVYVHGFSASKGEVRPLPDDIARSLGANLFYTRLTGHGRTGAAMAEASVNAWVNDMAEALAVGRAIGERVILMGTSTGATLITWAATQPELTADVAGAVLFSPNYGVQADGAFVLTMPWGAQIADLMTGGERGFEPLNELHAEYWTTSYPTRATLPMAALVKLAHEAPVEDTKVPALFIYSPDDAIVRPELTRAVAERWGAPHETVVVEETGDPFNHVIAGDALSPSTSDALEDKIIAWISALPE